MDLVQISKRLCQEVSSLSFGSPVAYVYNPLAYAAGPHEAYLRLAGGGAKETLLLGMNPGPFGMVQTGVPFGDATLARDYLGISGDVTPPSQYHPKRPVQGFECPRSEVSGTRLWSWVRAAYPDPTAFFERFLVWNYCPLAFLEPSGRNRTPDKLGRSERDALFRVCDDALRRVVDSLSPRHVVGIGTFAQAAAKRALSPSRPDLAVGRILHPSPASPAANRGWAEAATAGLEALGIAWADGRGKQSHVLSGEHGCKPRHGHRQE